MCNGLVMIRGLTMSDGEVSPLPSVLKIGMRSYLTLTTKHINIMKMIKIEFGI